MNVLKLTPACKDYLWGGHRLVDEFHKDYDGPVLAETWELSAYPDSPSIIANGDHAGESFADYVKAHPEALGKNCERFQEFPILIKFIDAKKALSIQVHPDNQYAYEHEHQPGKTEMWYVIDAEPGAHLYYGFEKEISKEEFRERIENNTLEEVLHAAPVEKGDVFFIQSGTLHAIGAGILIAEIQQNSNVTYRIYDYGRRDKDGKTRELHVSQALDVTMREPVTRRISPEPHRADCPYFTVDKINLDGRRMVRLEGLIGSESFAHILVLDGEGTIAAGEDVMQYQKGDSIFLPAGIGRYEIHGKIEALMTTERAD